MVSAPNNTSKIYAILGIFALLGCSGDRQSQEFGLWSARADTDQCSLKDAVEDFYTSGRYSQPNPTAKGGFAAFTAIGSEKWLRDTYAEFQQEILLDVGDHYEFGRFTNCATNVEVEPSIDGARSGIINRLNFIGTSNTLCIFDNFEFSASRNISDEVRSCVERNQKSADFYVYYN